VSGAIASLNADFNSIVRRGQVLARLDQSLFRTAVEQAQANVTRAEADLERLRVMAEDAEGEVPARPRAVGEAAHRRPSNWTRRRWRCGRRRADPIREAQVVQAEASLRQANVNLDKTIITSPIDGIVIARNVDVGQTVAASLQAPVLFQIAADLAEMQLKANIDESDLGAIARGSRCGSRSMPIPARRSPASVTQVRLNPIVEQNVVTYAAIITAPNPSLKLLPGMTATLTVETARRDGVLRVPAAALRFRPIAATGEARPAAGATNNPLMATPGRR
jgi:HlyD family secretion protein